MKRNPRITCLLALVLALGTGAVVAQEIGHDKVEILDARTAVSGPEQRSAEVYAYFVNVETNDRLIGADSSVCERVDFVAADGRTLPYEEFRLEDDVEAGFRPGEQHLRLVGLKKALVRGQAFVVTLHFEAGGALPLNVIVQ